MLNFFSTLKDRRFPSPDWHSSLVEPVIVTQHPHSWLCHIHRSVQYALFPVHLFNKSWLNMSQPANAPWVFASKVNMHLSTVNQSAFSNPNVQQGI
jgi:hypothetical protein